MSKRLRHAIHNEKACKFLRTRPEYADWIVTTSFYSALHFIEHYIFPFEHVEGGKKSELQHVGDYKKLRMSGKSKHELRIDLVKWKCPQLEVAYQWLYDTCNNARYFDYNFPNPSVTIQLAESYLKKIKTICSSK